MPRQVVFKLRGSGRWVDGHRNGAGQQHAEEALEVLTACRQHDGNCLTRLQPFLLEANGDPLSALLELSVS